MEKHDLIEAMAEGLMWGTIAGVIVGGALLLWVRFM